MIYVKDIGIVALLGRKVHSAKINLERDLVVLDTDKGKLYLTWEGECCSSCFIAHFSGLENLINSKIMKAHHSSWSQPTQSESYHDNVIQYMGTTLETTRGHVTFETRLEHNGYYSGRIMVSDVGPLGKYGKSRDDRHEDLIPLEDF